MMLHNVMFGLRYKINQVYNSQGTEINDVTQIARAAYGLAASDPHSDNGKVHLSLSGIYVGTGDNDVVSLTRAVRQDKLDEWSPIIVDVLITDTDKEIPESITGHSGKRAPEIKIAKINNL